MIVEKIHIDRFRAFNDIEFTLGKYITLIAGQNGTQKSTLLGMLTQPFTITDKENPLYGEKPLCGGSYKSSFQDKFRLSPKFDKPKAHEWSLYIKGNPSPFTVESMLRSKKDGTLRFWKKGSRGVGTGYIQYPVIFLSLKRLIPIAEEKGINSSDSWIQVISAILFMQREDPLAAP